jgi:hypothetical protein
MGRVVDQDDAHEEARGEGQENFGVFITEIAHSPISIRPYLGGGPGGL